MTRRAASAEQFEQRVLLSGTTQLASVNTAGVVGDQPSYSPAISADGRFVAFYGYATNMGVDNPNLLAQIYVRDLQTGVTTVASTDSNGNPPDHYGALYPSLSGDGRYVIFVSNATNLVPDDTNGVSDVFMKDMQTGITTRVSVDSAGNQSNAYSVQATISDDGRFVAFFSAANNLVSGDVNNAGDIFVHDLVTGETRLVSTASDGSAGNFESVEPTLSGDGRLVAFRSTANNLVPGDTNAVPDVFVKDLQTGVTTRVSVSSAGVQSNNLSQTPTLSGDGRSVVFYSYSDILVPGDTNSAADIFVRDLVTGETTRVSVSSTGEQGFGGSYLADISTDGRYVSFQSDSSNLVNGDVNGTSDVFVHDRQTGITQRISVMNDGHGNRYGSLLAAISGDGHSVVHFSYERALEQGGDSFHRQIFVFTEHAPASIALSNATIPENRQVGATIGKLSATDPDPRERLTFSLVSGPGSTDNASFALVGSQLITTASFDYETKNSYSIRVRVTDSVGLTYEQTFEISVTDVNERPVIAGFDTPVTYPVGHAPLLLDSNVTVADPDSADFAGGRLTAKLTQNAESSDLLSIKTFGGVTLSGSDVLVGGIVVGTFSGGSGWSALAIELNSNATRARVQTLLRAIAFSSSSSTPSNLPRTVEVKVTDGDGGVSAPVTKTISI
ncbi:cadherin domain-containing protein [Planctomicrobium piriforme]|uniref:WD40-like Beta Propeller Repeat n=1 Tax=Planctomicrobium piriforme TaxID=1576369 RepID=A0A1I3TLB8_9PLAN|nr:cadherin domain-containing protein [Planctomicrobium piriforme]SFJ71179.1 WD40-like Beta Propeller Repeat [Planctomicrobium piriforme]